MKINQPTESQIKTAVAWLRAVQDTEAPACKAVADWLEARLSQNAQPDRGRR